MENLGLNKTIFLFFFIRVVVMETITILKADNQYKLTQRHLSSKNVREHLHVLMKLRLAIFDAGKFSWKNNS